MPNAKYRAGRAFEYRVRDDLAKHGCVHTVRAAGSHGVADLVTFGMRGGPQTGRVFFVQCKRNGWISHAEAVELFEASRDVGAIALLAVNVKGKIVYSELISLFGPKRHPDVWRDWDWS